MARFPHRFLLFYLVKSDLLPFSSVPHFRQYVAMQVIVATTAAPALYIVGQ